MLKILFVMFHPETEDMLPRTAPRPTMGISLKEPATKPTVPEVSLLYNQPTLTTISSSISEEVRPTKTVQTYAAWKKSTLPKLVNTAITEKISHTESTNKQTAIPLNMKVNSTEIPRHTIAANLCSCAHSSSTGGGSIRPTEMQFSHVPQRRSLDAFLPINSEVSRDRLANTHFLHREVLTVCASTQTDFQYLSSNHFTGNETQQLIADLPTKQDYKNMLLVVQDMRVEQQRLMQICSMLLEQYQEMMDNKRAVSKDVSTQYDGTLLDIPQQRPITKKTDYIEEGSPGINAIGILRPNIMPHPIAQSPDTATNSVKYYLNTARVTNNHQLAQQSRATTKPNHEPQKQITDQSLAMNQLALKYLPNNKLSELLQEMHMTTSKEANDEEYSSIQQGSNSREEPQNIEKGGSDISNTSYRYLKKYRLLPEVQDANSVSPVRQLHNSNKQNGRTPLLESQQCPRYENVLDLETIRKQPKFL